MEITTRGKSGKKSGEVDHHVGHCLPYSLIMRWSGIILHRLTGSIIFSIIILRPGVLKGGKVQQGLKVLVGADDNPC